MWVADFRMWHESHMLDVTRKHEVRFGAYYLNWFTDRGKRFVNKLLFIEGRDWEAALKELAADPRIRVIYLKGNQMLYSIPELESFHASILDRTVISLKPQYAEKGFEYWTLGSTQKKALLDLVKKVNSLKGKAGIELLSLREEDPNFFAQGALESLTRLQREAVLAAFNAGYYEYPRKADLKKLAKRLGVPRTTLTEHLRKAEAKIMPLALTAIAKP